MIRKIIVGFLWFFVLYFGSCFLAGAIVGGIAGGRDPQHAVDAARTAVSAFMGTYRPVIVVVALLAAGFGAVKGILPGTRSKRPAA